MKVSDLASVLPAVYGLIDVVSDSHDEELALSCSSEYVTRKYGDRQVTGITIKLVIHVP